MTEHAKLMTSVGSTVGVAGLLLLGTVSSMYTVIGMLLLVSLHAYAYALVQECVADYYYELSTHDSMVSSVAISIIVLIELTLFLAVYAVLVCNMWILAPVCHSIHV